jgi:protocatechuate 3,4-dioxygenase, alpha subunit
MTGLTPSQTVGPFLSLALVWPDGPHVVEPGTPGAVRVYGQVFDGTGAPVSDALVETWQADPDGRFAHPDDPRGPASGEFRGLGRCPTGDDGTYEIVTRKPGPVPAADGGTQAPHLDVFVLARGLLNHVVTRLYFDDEPGANGADPVLASVDPARRATLLARADGSGGYRFDIRLQGERETVFFAL